MNAGEVRAAIAANRPIWVLRTDELKGAASDLVARASVSRSGIEEAIAQRLDSVPLKVGDVLLLILHREIVAAGVVTGVQKELSWLQVQVVLAASTVFAGEAEPAAAPKRLEGATRENLLRALDLVIAESMPYARNIILYGPPGTGKTYRTVDRALELVDGDWYAANHQHRDAVTARFRALQQAGRIAIVTFHQSYGYEEFIEGLRPEIDEATGNVVYEVKAGVLKRIAFRALAEGLVKPPKGAGDISFEAIWARFTEFVAADEAREYKSKQGLLYDGWMSRNGGFQIQRSTDDKGTSLLIASRLQMKKIWDARQNLGAPKDVTAGDLSKIVGKGAVQSTVQWIAYEHLFNLAKDVTPETVVQVDPVEEVQAALDGQGATFSFSGAPQYVLIVDEINRGNISKILGELITLIEADKRVSMPEELRLPLAYSPESLFGLPPNLHIVGTMNTADRSIALLDIALRRRFEFEEVGPDALAIDRELEKAIPGNEHVRLRSLVRGIFETLNRRIRFLYDEDHQLGHALFTSVRTHEDLRRVLVDRVIPLLKEYFYGQWEKVCLVLGSYESAGSLRKVDYAYPPIIWGTVLNEKTVLGFGHDDYEDDKFEYRVNPNAAGDTATSKELELIFLGVLSPMERTAFLDTHKGHP